ncbi:MAG: DUF1385 domain-containing protein [Lachnospiraceae bacterium]|nr:DUF1385 domain-containing protein [Lachnospiraceae bacterium]
MKSSGIGGQAVMEGIMMKNGDTYAVAVRKPDKEIVVKKDVHKTFKKCEKLTKLPFIRGVFNFIDSLLLGMSTLTYSAEFYEEDEEPSKLDKALEKFMGGFGEKFIMGMTVAVSIILAVGIFMIFPYFLAELFQTIIVSDILLALLEGVIRVAILLGYIFLISKIEDIQRVFMYHGAEHKCINCIEHGLELNVENVMKSSKEHKRCGTSFLLVVMVVSIIFFLFIRVDSAWLRVVLRILLVPVIAGVSYEFIRLAGRSDNKIVLALSKPGMLLQRLTTSEPDESMVEVAIKAVEAVFDWEAYLEENKEGFVAEKAEKEPEAEMVSSPKVGEKAEATQQEEADVVPEYSARETKTEPKKGPADIVEDNTLPAPRLTEVNDSEKGVIHLQWEKVKKASGYVVYRKNAEEDIYKMYSDIKKNTFDDVEVEPDMIYYYRVRAFVQKGDKKVYGQLSPIESNGYSSRVKSKY